MLLSPHVGWPREGRAAEPDPPADIPAEIRYEQHVAPILQRRCARCHGPQEAESGLRLDRRSSLLRGGDLGEPTVVPGKPKRSFLMLVVQGEADIVMPPEGEPLSDREIEILRRWIAAGAKMPTAAGDEDTTPLPWSYQPLRRPDPPHSPSLGSLENPLDAFVTRRLTEAGLNFSPDADRRTLIRRLYLVMLGLPPTPSEVDRFLADSRPDAWPRLVDRVLADPHYGERWGQHWLDVIRFGETHGYETNRERPHAWRYRDWVIDSLNRDLPYDAFIRAQLAGDALDEPIATGFLVAGPHDLVKSPDINLTLMQRQDELSDLINATSSALLGLTVGCARCHNHKFDPITQVDYYSIQAVFAGVQHADRPLPPDRRAKQRLARVQSRIDSLRERLKPFQPRTGALLEAVNARHNVEPLEPVEARWVRFTIEATNGAQPCIDELEIFAADDDRNVALASAGATAQSSSNLPGYEIHKLEHINDGRYGNSHSWISNEPGGWVQIQLAETTRIHRVEWARDRDGKYRDRVAVKYRIEVATEPDRWRQVASSERRQPFGANPDEPVYDFSTAAADQAAEGRRWLQQLKTALAERKQLSQPRMAYAGVFAQPQPTHRLYRGDPLAKREVTPPDTIAVLGELDLPLEADEQQRRLRFAEWLTEPTNPLPARVMANRIWQHHFGVGLVATPSDLGASGVKPSHPKLLDWLATELVDHGWSLKRLHRRILLSRTWRQSSRPRPAAVAIDAGSRLLWRFPPRRLEAEAIRDAILTVTNSLDERMRGPGFSGFEVQRENVRHYFPKQSFGPEDWRRMVYMTKVRQEREAVFGVFDCPDASQLKPVRSRSTTPLQALNLLNSRFVLQQAERLAARLEQEADSSEQQVRRAYLLCYGRAPSAEAIGDAVQFIAAEGLSAFCRAMLNSNEFLYLP